MSEAAGSSSGTSNDRWIDAFTDAHAKLYTFASCITMADLSGDGDHKLIIADLGTGKYNMRLKVYKGVSLLAEQALVDLPTSVVTFILDQIVPRAPAVAVASGSNVFIYKNLKPYYKYSLQSAAIDETETEVWEHVKNKQLDTTQLAQVLLSLKQNVGYVLGRGKALGLSQLSLLSQRFLLTPEAEQDEFLDKHLNDPLKRQSCITCMTTLKKSSVELSAIDTLVLGCENGEVIVLDTEAFTALAHASVPSVPVFLHATGLFDVDYRILVCCRDGCVYTLKRDVCFVNKPTIELNCHIVGMTKNGKQIIIGCTDRTLRRFTLKGRRLSVSTMPAGITAIEQLNYEPKGFIATLVALDNKQIHVYQDTFIVDVIRLDEVPTAVRFGHFGREEGALIIVTRSGAISVKLLKRTAEFVEKSETAGAPTAQLSKLNIPKKSKIFVEQAMRERDNATSMHQMFQRDMFMLRLHTARAYAGMIESHMNPVSFDAEEMLKLSVNVLGFGPVFQMIIYLQTSSCQAVTDVSITFKVGNQSRERLAYPGNNCKYNSKLYAVEKPIMPVCMLVPGINYTFQTNITCLMPDKGLSDDIKVFVVKNDRSTPSITAVVTMPVCEQTLVD